jgi:chemotaxis protein methyltransferase CheR
MSVDVADVARFRSLLADRLGWAFVDGDQEHLARVLRQRTEHLGVGAETYLQELGAGSATAELTELAEQLTITETYFFRHGEQFRALTEEALPARIRDRAGLRQLRMLSVGCSSGEEAYTLGIVAHEVRPDPSWTVSVLGLDANPAMLRRAAEGRYSTWSLRETPDAVRQRWFRSHGSTFELDPALHDSVRFRQYNVADEDVALWHTGQYDVVFCRNLLMYLTPATARVLVHRMTRSLAAGGYLFLGHTDTLGSRPDGLEPLHTHGTFYYRRQSAAHRTPPAAATGHTSAAAEPVGDPAFDVHADSDVHARSDVHPGTPASTFRDRAMSLLRDERFGEALDVVKEGMPARPAPRDLLLQAVLLAQSGRLDDAEMTARRLLDVDGLYADAHHLLAVCLEGGAAVEVAIGHYRLAAYLDPDFAMPKLRLGLLARRRGDHRTAGTELDRALALFHTEREERIVLFGGGFGRISLVALCRAELQATGGAR